MKKKYKLTKTTKSYLDKTLYQIEALKDFGGVKKGDKGGWIEKEDNLSQEGNAWVCDNARVFDNARVSDNAWIYGDARVYGNAQVYGNALVYGDARVFDNARVCGDAWVFDNARVCGNAWIYGSAEACGIVEVYGNARLSSKSKFIRGFFVGGSDEDNITEITNKTGSTYWKHQYTVGRYKIEPIDEAKKEALKHYLN